MTFCCHSITHSEWKCTLRPRLGFSMYTGTTSLSPRLSLLLQVSMGIPPPRSTQKVRCYTGTRLALSRGYHARSGLNGNPITHYTQSEMYTGTTSLSPPLSPRSGLSGESIHYFNPHKSEMHTGTTCSLCTVITSHQSLNGNHTTQSTQK